MMIHLRHQFVFLSVAAATLLLFVAASNAHAQGATSTATLQGRVFDSTAGGLPGVTVTIVDMGTNQSRTVVTNEQGVYRFAGLTPGRYTVSGELQGFAKFVQPNVALNVGAAVDID